ncbi:MAG TPA: non-ribosomal peptide synthetase, partial [Anaerolineae bacterium]|nr:non-ribosomal peptide synthetase [Anaerolineae bacterium]
AMLTLLSPDNLPALTHVLSAGEACPPGLVQKWAANCKFYNGYGPTETTVCATLHLCDPAEVGSPPIGKPIANSQIYILDKKQRPVPVGVPGELHIGGVHLARGYLNRPALTAEKFIQLPNYSITQLPNYPITVYRTGDLCHYRLDGSIEFLGRIDHQIKIRGFRIELGEIEAMLGQHEAVETAVAAAVENEQGENHLIAYLVPAGENEIDFDELRAYLQNYLPLYMIPDQFILLDQLPRLPNGKVNRRALPVPDLPQSQYVAPRNPAEEILAGLWTQVLSVERVGVYDNFFALGGHSLKATQLVSRIREAFQRDLPLRRLFENPTIADTAVFLQTEQANGRPPIQPVPRDATPPLSFAQQRLWFLEQLSPGNIAYNIPMALRLSGALDVAGLQQSLQEIARRHEALRTVFVEENGRPVQRILPDLPIDLPVTDLRHLPEAERESQAQALAVAEAKRPFDLATGPLIRAALLQLADDEYVALLTMHHIISDGWSMGVFIQEMATLYAAFAAGRPSPLPELPIQYADFAHWQREWLQGDALESQLAYWKEQLAGATPFLDLPTDRPRPAIQSANGATETFVLPPELAQQLAELSQTQGATLFMTLLAAFQILLSRYANQTNVSVGTPIANRTQAEIEGLIGFFVNTLVMRTDLSGQPDFTELLARVRETALGAYAHQDLPFEMLVEELQPGRDLSHTPLFQVMFVLDNAPLDGLELPNLTLSPVEADGGTATFDMTLTLRESPDGLLGMWEYNTDLFDRSTIQRMIGHFQTLLEGIAADPQ